MPEEFRIKRTKDDRVDRHGATQLFDLLNAALHEMGGVGVRRAHGPVTVVVFLVLAAGDAVVLDAGVAAMSDLRINLGQIVLR